MRISDQLAVELNEMSSRKLRKIIKKRGCIELRQKGSHIQVRCDDPPGLPPCHTTIPVHGSKDIKKGTLGAIERSLKVCLGPGWVKAEAVDLIDEPWLAEAVEDLPESPWSYFLKVAGTKLLPLAKLRPTRARPSGIANANKYMRLAYDDKGKKRKPIDVRQEKDGTYTITDGNSTYANAKANRWKSIPAVVS